MNIKKFKPEDFEKIEEYLSDRYNENKNMTSWLPERFNDLFYRLNPYYKNKGRPCSTDFVWYWEENDEIVACILPDGDAIYISIKNGYEYLFESVLKFAEENCLPLFEKNENGEIDFLVVSNDSLRYRIETLKNMGYKKDEKQDYDNYIYPSSFSREINLSAGYVLVYGDSINDEEAKWNACHLGFHPDDEGKEDLENPMDDYNSRKFSHLYKDSFECLVVTKNNDICSYSFCYVNKKNNTAFIEPVSTREKYRHLGIGSAMMAGVIKKCQELGIEKVYVNSFDWRREFYNAAGFTTEDEIGFWFKKINNENF